MTLKLTVYTDDTLTEVKRVIEADELKIPYRVALRVAESLDSINLNNNDDLLKFISGNLDKVDKIIKATFGVSEAELECVNVTDLAGVGMELYKWALDKISSLKGGNEKN